MVAYNYALIGPGAYFSDSSSQRQTPISSSTVTGNSWTASIPLTWIGNLAHFWADAVTLKTSGGITSPIDRAPRNSLYTEIILPSTAPVTTLPGCYSPTYYSPTYATITSSSTTTSTTSYATTSAISSIGTAYFSNQAWNPEFGTVVYAAIIVAAIAVGAFYILHKRKH